MNFYSPHRYDMKPTTDHEPTLCKVCGARVRNWQSKATTCDPVCTRAKQLGLTRGQQMREDMKRSAIAFREADELGKILSGAPMNRPENVDYNRPYLNVLFA